MTDQASERATGILPARLAAACVGLAALVAADFMFFERTFLAEGVPDSSGTALLRTTNIAIVSYLLVSGLGGRSPSDD